MSAFRFVEGKLEFTVGFYRRDTPKLHVVLWLEEDVPAKPADATALAGEIRSALLPHVTATVTVTSLALERAARTPLRWLAGRSVRRASAP